MINEYKATTTVMRSRALEIMTIDQFAKCKMAIHTASVAAGAEAVILIPGIDAIPITATQITMIIALGKIFDQQISESVAKGIVGAAASTFVGRNLVKFIPFAGMAVSAAISAGITEAIGWTAAVDFANQASKSEKSDKDSLDGMQYETLDDLEAGEELVITEEVNEDISCYENEDGQDDESLSRDAVKELEEDE